MPTRASLYEELPKIIFDDVEFELGMDSVSMSDSASINSRIVPGTTRNIVQQMGNSPTIFNVGAFLVDDEEGINSDKAFDIHTRMREAGEVDFVHPYYGRHRVRISGLSSSQDHTTGQTKITFSLVVVGNPTQRAIRLPADALRQRATNLGVSYGEEFERAYAPPTSAAEQATIVGQIRNWTDEAVDNILTPTGEGRFLWDRFRGIAEPVLSLTEESIDLINDGVRFQSETQQLFGYLGNAGTPDGLLRALSYIHNRYTLRGDGAFTTLLRGLGLARQLNILGSTPLRELFTRRPDAEAYVNTLITQLDEETNLSPENQDEIKEAIDEVYTYVDDQLPDLFNVKNVTLAAAVPRLVLAHKEFGDKDRADDIRFEGDYGLIVRNYEVDVR